MVSNFLFSKPKNVGNAKCRPTIDRVSTNYWPIHRSSIDQLSAKCRWTKSYIGRDTSGTTIDRVSIHYQPTIERHIDRLSTSISTAILTDISVDITHSKQDPAALCFKTVTCKINDYITSSLLSSFVFKKLKGKLAKQKNHNKYMQWQYPPCRCWWSIIYMGWWRGSLQTVIKLRTHFFKKGYDTFAIHSPLIIFLRNTLSIPLLCKPPNPTASFWIPFRCKILVSEDQDKYLLWYCKYCGYCSY